MTQTTDARVFGRLARENFGKCTKCRLRNAEDKDGMCRACMYQAKYDERTVTTKQVISAFKLLRGTEGLVRWPYPDLSELAGPMPLGHVVYVVAGTGVGKTTVTLDVARRWVAEGVGVTILPLETSPGEFRLSLAAVELGIPHGTVYDLIDRNHTGDPSAVAQYQLLEDILRRQAPQEGDDQTMMKLLHIHEDEEVTVEALDRACAIAKKMGHKVLIVDHIDQIGADRDEFTGRVAQGLDAVKQVNDAVLKLAKHYNLLIICMSQANSKLMGDGTNPLLRFKKLQLQDVLYNTYKNKNATQIIGIFRPLKAGLTVRDFRMARDGEIDPMEVLATGRMGLNMIKLRKRGENEQKWCELAYTNGRLRGLTEDEKEHDRMLRSMSDPISHTSPVFRTKEKSA